MKLSNDPHAAQTMLIALMANLLNRGVLSPEDFRLIAKAGGATFEDDEPEQPQP